jgi:short-subunit dehydrogenase
VKTVLDRAGGRIDALINNAGVALYGAVEETTIDEARALFDTNFFGVMRVTQAALPAMRAQGFGRIVIVGSVVGFVAIPYESIYVAAKYALEGWAEALAYEVEPFRIAVSLIEPAFIRTDIDRNVARAQASIPAYAQQRRRAEAGLARNVVNGDDPAVVAETVWKALSAARPRLHYLAGRQARRLRLLRTIMPPRVFSIGVRRSTFAD